MFSQSTADPVTVASDEIVGSFNRSMATPAVALDIFKTSDIVWHPGLLHKLNSYGSLSQIYGLTLCLFSVIEGFKWFWMGILHNHIQLVLELRFHS